MIYLEVLAKEGVGWRIPVPLSHIKISGSKAVLVKPVSFVVDQACTLFKGRLTKESLLNPGEYDIIIEDLGLQLASSCVSSGTRTIINQLEVCCDNAGMLNCIFTP